MIPRGGTVGSLRSWIKGGKGWIYSWPICWLSCFVVTLKQWQEHVSWGRVGKKERKTPVKRQHSKHVAVTYLLQPGPSSCYLSQYAIKFWIHQLMVNPLVKSAKSELLWFRQIIMIVGEHPSIHQFMEGCFIRKPLHPGLQFDLEKMWTFPCYSISLPYSEMGLKEFIGLCSNHMCKKCLLAYANK